MHLYFIRHGQSANNLLYEKTGDSKGRQSDPELTDYGREQIGIVGDFLANGRGNTAVTQDARHVDVGGFGITHLYTSPMVRAMDTAGAIGNSLGIAPVVRDDVFETGGIWLEDPDTGEWIGKPGANRTFFEDRYPGFVLPNHFNGEGWWNRPAETKQECLSRAQRFLVAMQAEHAPDARVAVVSHGMFYNMLVRALLNLPVEINLWFAMNNVAISKLKLTDSGEQSISYQNRVDFLPPELIT